MPPSCPPTSTYSTTSPRAVSQPFPLSMPRRREVLSSQHPLHRGGDVLRAVLPRRHNSLQERPRHHRDARPRQFLPCPPSTLERYRLLLVTDDVVKLCMAVLNASQRSQSTVEQALRVLRILSSMGRASSPRDSPPESMTRLMVANGVVPSVQMAIAAYPQSVPICAHGIRTMQWIMEAPNLRLVRIMLDEQVLQLCADLLRGHDDPRVLQFLCGVLTKFCYYLSRRCGGMLSRQREPSRGAAASARRGGDAGEEDDGAVQGRARGARGHPSALRDGVGR